MLVLSISIESPFDVAVRRPEHPNARVLKGPPSSAAMITASPAVCHSGLRCFDFGSAMSYAAR
jgi:hypothetical protein